MVGSLCAALIGEVMLLLLLPQPPIAPDASPKNVVDILFVLDTTGSMQNEIDGISRGIRDVTNELSARRLDGRVGLIAFTDRKFTPATFRSPEWIGRDPVVLTFGGATFTDDTEAFRTKISQLRANGGGDLAESSLDAIALASRQPFRKNAAKVLILITDAPPHVPDVDMASVEMTANAVRDGKIDQLHLVVPTEFLPEYAGLHSGAPGKDFPLTDSSGGRVRFDTILPEVSREVAVTAVGTAITTGTYDPATYWRLAALTGLWTGLLALGIFVSLVIGQN